MISIVLVDDHPVVRGSIRLLLQQQSDMRVVDEAGTPEAALAAIADSAPDVAVVDASLGAADGVALTETIVARWKSVRVVALTMHNDPVTVRQMLRAGAAAYVVKGAQPHELVEAIRAVAAGGAYLHPLIAAGVVADAVRGGQQAELLSPREQEVVRLLAHDYTTRQCAETLGLSEHTINRHVANAMRKLRVRNRAGLVRYSDGHAPLPGGTVPT